MEIEYSEIEKMFIVNCPEVYVYKIKDTYYFIGGAVFRFCSAKDVDNFNKFEQEFERLKKEKNISTYDLKLLQEHYKEYISVYEKEVNDENLAHVRKIMKNIFKCLSENDFKSLFEQKKRRDDILNYINNNWKIMNN